METKKISKYLDNVAGLGIYNIKMLLQIDQYSLNIWFILVYGGEGVR